MSCLYAKAFKEILKSDTAVAAVFKIEPRKEDVIVNLDKLWNLNEFKLAVEDYANRSRKHHKALNNFKNTQKEVVINSELKSDLIICLSGSSSDFDDLCDQAKITDDERKRILLELHGNDMFPGEVGFLEGDGCQRVIQKVPHAWLQRTFNQS